jgi:tRNA nucleotidyltransferase/poly(A) polymerase
LGLEKLSRERVRAELLKLLVTRRATPALAAMTESGLLVMVLGGVPDLAGFENMAKVEAEAGVQADPVQRLGALAVRIDEDAGRLWQRLRLANAEHERLRVMGDAWWRISAADDKAARALLYRLGSNGFVDRSLVAWARSPATAHDPAWRAMVGLPERWAVPVFPLKAADFMKRGVSQGPALGATIAAAEQAWIVAGFPGDQASLNAIAADAVRAKAPQK